MIQNKRTEKYQAKPTCLLVKGQEKAHIFSRFPLTVVRTSKGNAEIHNNTYEKRQNLNSSNACTN